MENTTFKDISITSASNNNKTWQNVYGSLTVVMSFLSVIGCCLIFVTYFIFKDLQNVSRRLLNYLSFADCMTAIGNLLGILWVMVVGKLEEFPGKYLFCKFHSGLTIYSSICSYFWTTETTVYLYICLVHQNFVLANKMVRGFHVISWGIPAIIVIICLGFDAIGTDKASKHSSWCWINSEVKYMNILFWQYFSGKLWEIISWVLTVIFTILIRIHLLKQKRHSSFLFGTDSTSTNSASSRRNSNIDRANRKMTFIPVVFLTCRIWGTIRFLLGAYAPEYSRSKASLWIIPLQGIGDSAQGFANAVLYCCVTRRMRQRIRNCCNCKRHQVALQQPSGNALKRNSVSKDGNDSRIATVTLEHTVVQENTFL